MTLEEFSELFDVNYNNITSNQAAGLNEYEKSVFLTKAQDEIIKNYFTSNSKGNNIQQGFDDSAKRQADFSVLMKTASCDPGTVGTNSSTVVKKYICSAEGESSVVLYGSDLSFTSEGQPYNIENNDNYTVEDGIITIEGDPTVEVTVTGFPFTSGSLSVSTVEVISTSGKIDQRSKVYTFPSDVFIIINEALADIPNKKYFQVIPLRYDEYTRLMSKPFKRPLKNQAWRLINSGVISGSDYIKCVELITTPEYDNKSLTYTLRFLRRPKPIIVGDIDDLKINGCSYDPNRQCELDPILHEDILQRAVELAKIAWTSTGQDNVQLEMTAGQRSE